jgi:hypothetical protein
VGEGVAVGVAVGVGDGVAVGVAVGVSVDGVVGVAVGGGVAVRAGVSAGTQAASRTISTSRLDQKSFIARVSSLLYPVGDEQKRRSQERRSILGCFAQIT